MFTTLDDKIRETESYLSQLLNDADPSAVRVAWTGGKDSTLVLYIWRVLLEHHGLGPVKAINLDTGCKFPEVMAFRDRLAVEWDVDLHVARPDVVLEGYPLAVDTLECCQDLKIGPLKKAIRDTGASHLLTGIRRDEHPDRAGRLAMEERFDPAHLMVNPILDWTESDIWAFHARFGLSYCELYDAGFRSLGCQPCTKINRNNVGERSGRNRAKERSLKTLTSLGYF